LGRFLSIDPVAPSEGNEFNFNRYVYANDNPIKNIDPDGKSTSCADIRFCNVAVEPSTQAPIYGKAQVSSKTPTHASTSARIASEAASEPDTKSVHLNQSLRTITGNKDAPNVRPDVGVVKNNGDIHQVEVQSRGQTAAELQDKMALSRSGLGVGGTDIVVEPDPVVNIAPRPSMTVGAFGAIGVIQIIFHAYVDKVVKDREDAKKTPEERAAEECAPPGCV
jgi:hypothetical protein